jgi:hypothetical protein
VHLQRVGSIFEFVLEAVLIEGELSRFANGNEGDSQFQSQRSSEQEPSRFAVGFIALKWSAN